MNIEKILNWAVIIILPTLLFVVSPYWSSTFKDYKELQYDIVSSPKLNDFGFSEDSWPELKFVYEEQMIEKGGFVLISFQNTGTIPIKRNDFDKPIIIEFEKESKVIGFRKISSVPDELAIDNKLTSNVIEIMPLLLNPGDKFYAEALIQGEVNFSSIGTRIIGIKNLKKKENAPRNGLYIEDVSGYSGTNTSSHKPLFFLNKYFLLMISFFLITISFLSFSQSVKYGKKRDFLEVILSLSVYFLGMFTLLLAAIAIADSKWQAIAILVGTFSIAGVGAYLLPNVFMDTVEKTDEPMG